MPEHPFDQALRPGRERDINWMTGEPAVRLQERLLALVVDNSVDFRREAVAKAVAWCEESPCGYNVCQLITNEVSDTLRDSFPLAESSLAVYDAWDWLEREVSGWDWR